MTERWLLGGWRSFRAGSPADLRGALGAALDSSGDVAVHADETLAVAATPAERVRPGTESVLCLLDGRVFNVGSIAGRLGLDPGTDAERTLAEAWERHGDRLLPQLSGTFSLLLWDRERRRGALVRDPLGTRPLFWAGDGSGFAFASEIRPLLGLLARTPAPDPIALAHWLTRSRPPPDLTLFEGVRRLPAGHLLRFGDDGCRAERWWTPRYSPPREATASGAAAELREEMSRAFARTTANAGRSGLRLSGGFDSGSIAALAASREPGAKLRAYSLVFPAHPEVDESARIADLRKRLELEGVSRQFQGGSALSAAAEFIRSWSVPPSSPNGFLWRPLFRQAAIDGVDVMLDGNGGDELFGCSPYLLADQLRHGRLLALMRSVRRLPGMGANPPAGRIRRGLGQYALRGGIPPRIHRRARRARSHRRRERPWLRDHVASTVRDFESLDEWKRLRGPRWWSGLVNSVVLIPDALAGADELRREAAMAGVSFAHPWRDPELIAHVLGQPPELSFDPVQDRALARRAMEGLLPDAVRLSEAKPHFNVLLEESLRGPDAPMFDDLIANPPEELTRHVLAGRLEDLKQRSAAPGAALDAWRVATAALWLRFVENPGAFGDPPAQENRKLRAH